MPEIGDQLRETRMRNRIDISEVEAATKIRAKYLRALENEEWDLLPGPTFVKTFLRTYADYLGLDARNLVEEYRARYERPSAQELTPFGTNIGARRARPRRPVPAPWMAVLAGIVVLLGVLWLLGNWGDEEDPGDEVGATRTPTATAAPGGGDEGDGEEPEKSKRTPAKRTVVRLQIQPTGPVSVCLENAGGEPLIQNITLQANQDTETFRSKRFRMSFGTGEAVMRVDGKAYPVSDDAPIGYEVRAGRKPKALPEAERPTCE
jgi:cytoskeleton protein RodZ